MSASLILHDLAPSPNSIKIRLALGYKDLPFEKVPVDPMDRTSLVGVSGQPLAPVLVHGDRVVFDSAAILRYLDANFRSTPRLYSADYEEMREIESWEDWVKAELAPAVVLVIRQFFAGTADASVFAQAGGILERASARLEDSLKDRPWLLGEAPRAADLVAAPFVFYGMLPEAAAATNPVAGFFRQHLTLPADRKRTAGWVGRAMAFDR